MSITCITCCAVGAGYLATPGQAWHMTWHVHVQAYGWHNGKALVAILVMLNNSYWLTGHKNG